MRLLKCNLSSLYLLSSYNTVSFELSVSNEKFNCSKSSKSKSDDRKGYKNYLSDRGFIILNFLKSEVHNCVSGAEFKYLQCIPAYEQLINSKIQPWRKLEDSSVSYEDIKCNGVSVVKNIQFNDEVFFKEADEAWLKGNIVSSLHYFSYFYDHGDKVLQRRVIKRLQCLIFTSLEKNGNIFIKNMLKNVKTFSLERNEFAPLTFVWYGLFISTWYENNLLANSLIEDVNFKKHIEPFFPYYGAIFLSNNEVGIYQRLIEATLCHHMDNAAGILLRLLFDYYYKAGYLSGCSAVYKCCNDLGVELTRDQIYKYTVLKKADRQMKSPFSGINPSDDLLYKF